MEGDPTPLLDSANRRAFEKEEEEVMTGGSGDWPRPACWRSLSGTAELVAAGAVSELKKSESLPSPVSCCFCKESSNREI